MPIAWFWISLVAFVSATVVFCVSGFVLLRLLNQLVPLLDDTKNQVQDLGDLAASTVGHASDAMDIVEARVSQVMGQAALSGKSAANQALGVGTALTGLYMVTRLIGAVRKTWQAKQREAKRHQPWWRFGK